MSQSEQNERDRECEEDQKHWFAAPKSCRIPFTLCAQAFLQVLTSSASAARNRRPSPLLLPRRCPRPGISSPVPLRNSGQERSQPAFPRSTGSRPSLPRRPLSQPAKGKREREGGREEKRDRERLRRVRDKGEQKRGELEHRVKWLGRQRTCPNPPSVCVTERLTCTLLCFSSSYTWIIRDI